MVAVSTGAAVVVRRPKTAAQDDDIWQEAGAGCKERNAHGVNREHCYGRSIMVEGLSTHKIQPDSQSIGLGRRIVINCAVGAYCWRRRSLYIGCLFLFLFLRFDKSSEAGVLPGNHGEYTCTPISRKFELNYAVNDVLQIAMSMYALLLARLKMSWPQQRESGGKQNVMCGGVAEVDNITAWKGENVIHL
ncbi:hypothetical protein L211DRAFT_192778 [Terfezia boudieri ATCC MYA-4762]|uniref:Uncharacterized protein n=1 Tax=Terfezia boudieri ATCC MYA-4762 TaxID=1051890 RepID=A0A3N4LN43_9PEZI|nr:hypothetical protein L211DRAFT_192778 [Terfezia boudieri ATCC MYA-4762]